MPWEKQFDVDETLERAMHLFRRQGYASTSVQDLVHAMGINPGSLYPTYGNKRALFLRALRHYNGLFAARLTAHAREHSPRQAVTAVFRDAVRDAMANPDHAGCLLANTAVELAGRDEEVAGIVAEGLGETEAFFRDLIKAGHMSGDIPAAVNPAQTARVLLALLNGLRVLARGHPERPALDAVVRHAEDCLS